jgi:hypothetical protein
VEYIIQYIDFLRKLLVLLPLSHFPADSRDRGGWVTTPSCCRCSLAVTLRSWAQLQPWYPLGHGPAHARGYCHLCQWLQTLRFQWRVSISVVRLTHTLCARVFKVTCSRGALNQPLLHLREFNIELASLLSPVLPLLPPFKKTQQLNSKLLLLNGCSWSLACKSHLLFPSRF